MNIQIEQYIKYTKYTTYIKYTKWKGDRMQNTNLISENQNWSYNIENRNVCWHFGCFLVQ